MPPLTKSTAAAALLLAFAPLAVPDMAAATEASMTTVPADENSATAPAEEDPSTPVEDVPTPVEEPTQEPTQEPIVEPAPSPSTTGPAPTPEPMDAPSASAPSASAPAPRDTAAAPDQVTPNETMINVYVLEEGEVTGRPGQVFTDNSIFNIKNASGFSIPARSLDIHWSIDGPATFLTSRRPYSVANTGTANVAGCTFTNPKQTDCIGANPQPMYTSNSNNFNHIRVPIAIDATALPGDVVRVHGFFEPNAGTDYVNTNTETSTTWSVRIPLTAAAIDAPATIGPKPTITGDGVPGGTVDVTVGDQPLVTVPVGDDGRWSLPVTTGLPDGAVSVTAVQHRNGFTADPTTATLTVDATAPDAPLVDDPGTLTDPTGPITGTAEPGSTVIVRDRDGTELGRGTADDDGAFSIRLDGPLPEGATDLAVVAADAVGNESDSTTVTATVPDTTAPDAPSVERQELPTSTGPVVGTAEPGSTVIVRDADGTELGRGTADRDGGFAVELDDPLAEGAHDLVVVATDDADNESTPTPVTVVAPDVTAPEAPISTTPEFLSDGTGPFTGSAEPGSTVIVRDTDGTELGRAEAGKDGQFTVVLDEPLTDDAHDLELVAKDKAGNTSDPTPITVDVDDDAPNAPVVTSPTDLADGTGPITGIAEPGSTVIIRDEGGTEIGRTKADDNGDWIVELDEPLSDGSHQLEVIAEDKAGNISTPTPVTVVIDTEAPDAPVITSPADLADGTGPITGTAEPGSTVIVRDEDGKEIGRGTADDDGNWTIELDQPLRDGKHDLVVIVEDKAGNVSDPTQTTVEIDTEAPDAPKVTSPTDLADGQGPITGTAEPGSTVIVRDEDGTELGRTQADDDGNFEIGLDEPLQDGKHDLVVIVEDKAGNVSDPTETTVDIDTESPDAPKVTSPADLADGKGPISGTAEPGSTVIVRDEDGKEIGRGTAADDGNWSIELDKPLKDGSHDLVVIVEDKAGNISDPTETTVDIDTDAPDAPVLEGFDHSVDGTGVVRGTAEPGSTVVIRDADGREIGRGTADSDGRFAFRTTVPLEPGAHLLSVVAIDRAGNVSPGASMLVTLVPEHDDEDGGADQGETLPGIALPAITLPGTVAPSVGASSSTGTGTSDQRPASGTGSATKGQVDELAFTGAELGGWLTAALTALGLGVFLRLLGRRRRRDDLQH